MITIIEFNLCDSVKDHFGLDTNMKLIYLQNEDDRVWAVRQLISNKVDPNHEYVKEFMPIGVPFVMTPPYICNWYESGVKFQILTLDKLMKHVDSELSNLTTLKDILNILENSIPK